MSNFPCYPKPDEDTPEEAIAFIRRPDFNPGNFFTRLPGGLYREEELEGYEPLFADIDAALEANRYSLEKIFSVVSTFSSQSEETKKECREFFREIFMTIAPALLQKYKVRQFTS